MKMKTEQWKQMAVEEKQRSAMQSTREEKQRTAAQAAGTEKRMANLELLRCVAMMMVVVLHYLGKGKLLTDLTEESLRGAQLAAWLLESFCIVAVNVYMFLSGYFLSRSAFRLSRLIQLWLQIWVYSVAFGLAGALSGVMAETEFDIHYILTLLFPVSMEHYWFMTAYVFLYLLLPLAGIAAEKLTKRQLQVTVALLLSAFCILKSILPVRLETDKQGYDCIWYLCVFLAAAYVRRFGLPVLKRGRSCLLLYVGCCTGIFAGTMALRQVYLHTGSLVRIIKLFLEYNHILPFLAAVGLFGVFSRIQIGGRAAGLINRTASCTLGVYLLHENIGLRYTWQSWLGAERVAAGMAENSVWMGTAGLLLGVAGAVAAVFVSGVLIELGRQKLFGALHRGLLGLAPYRRLTQRIGAIDEAFRQH